MKLIHIYLALCLLSFSSCLRHKDFLLFRDGQQPAPNLKQLVPSTVVNAPELILQPSDVLAIIVASPEQTLTAPFSLVGGGQAAVQAITPISPLTYLVDKDGYIVVPGVGKVKAGGLTMNQLRDTLTYKVAESVVDPTVAVRLINFKVSVSGEVATQAIIPVESERITLVEALTKAGGLTPYSNRERVMVIREKNGQREVGEVNMQSPDLFQSPYYFLQQNDVVYVEPTKQVIAKAQQPVVTYLQPVQVGISLIALILALFR